MAKLKDGVFVSGRMAVNTKALGWTTKSMVMECTHGLMGVDIKEITRMIRKMGLVFIAGQMAESTQVNGRMINGMVEGSTLLMRITLRKDYGRTTRE